METKDKISQRTKRTKNRHNVCDTVLTFNCDENLVTVTSSGKQLTDLITVMNLTQMYPTDGMFFVCTD